MDSSARSPVLYEPAGNYSPGVDLCELCRIEAAIGKQGEAFLQRVYTVRERAVCNGDIPLLAGYWAVKEAVGKALGTGISGFRWTDIEVSVDNSGNLLVTLFNGAEAVFREKGWKDCHCSLSYNSSSACAFVLLIAAH